MCGIVYGASFTNKPINKMILKTFQGQRSRGTQGFGLYDREFGKLVRNPREDGILKWLKTKPSHEVLFHHRFPTSTDNVKNACHPFSTGDHFDTCYIMVHNGWLTNDVTLKADHENDGVEYHSEQTDGRFNDSEALLWDLAHYLEGKQDTVRSRGAIAFVCLAISKDGKDDKVYFGRNGSSPLKMKLTPQQMLLSSEGKGNPIEINKLYTFSYSNKQVEKKDLQLETQYTYNAGRSSSGADPDWGSRLHGNHWGYSSSTGLYAPDHPRFGEDRRFVADGYYGEEERDADIDLSFLDDEDDELQLIANKENQNDDAILVCERITTESQFHDVPQVVDNAKLAASLACEQIGTLEAKYSIEERQRDIQNRYRAYMLISDGYFESAIAMLGDDKDILQSLIDDFKQAKGYPDVDLAYEMAIQNATIDVTLLNPFWQGVDSQDPIFARRSAHDTYDESLKNEGEKNRDKTLQLPLLPAPKEKAHGAKE